MDTRVTTFQVASEHEVTIRYQDEDGRTIKASTTITAQPLDWSDDITAPGIVGFTFHHWVLSDGVTIDTGSGQSAGDEDTEGSATINIGATYAGTLTAVYTKKNMIYFNNTLGWDHVYVYFYSSDKYWVEDHIEGHGCGTGSKTSYEVDGSKAYFRGYHGAMTQIEGTNIWYYDYEADWGDSDGGEIKGYDDVVFVKNEQNNYEFFYSTKACRRGDFDHSLSMFVPEKTVVKTKNGTQYYNNGYWMNYPENTGYELKVYDGTTSGASEYEYKSVYFPFTADYTLPASVTMDLEANKTYGFTVARADGSNYRYSGTFNNSGSQNLSTGTSHTGVRTSAAGDYTFTLSSSAGTYSFGVKYPVAVNDWRILYKDLAAWSGATHTASWNHPSAGISKNGSATEAKRDIVSFYWAYGSSPTLQTQQCTAVGTGSVTWGTPSSALDMSAYSSVLTQSGVYNFIFEQPAGGASISLVGVEPYEGDYYIRTDCAGGGKWDNFRNDPHHLMTYSDYTKTNWGYTHYYTHWVTNGTNVKYTIANDYSQCISDSLIGDYGTVVANIDGNGFLSSSDANIRFMWNEATNKLSRAYIAGSGSITDRFLVLEGDAKMFDAAGNALTDTYQDHDAYGNYLGTDNQVILHDDQNFVYERTIKVQTKARAKLTAKYNNNIQYFIGGASETIELLGGETSATKHNMRIVYDFKTNRLVTAYVPSGVVDEPIDINADIMLVREHQEAGEQLKFSGSGALNEVKTVYGVMRFNRWTLNNKSTAAGHAALGDPKSAYERGLYWISFPFDVNLSDVFGFGTYGLDWIIMEYDGAERASKGYWIDSDGFWKYITDRSGKTLEAGKGYVLALDLDRMKSDNMDFWVNNIEHVELFFPSADDVEGISETTAHTTVDEHECTIDRRTDKTVNNINKDRTKADSHWNIIGVPSFANYNDELTSDEEGENTVIWHNPATQDLPYLYEWNMVDNTYTVQSGSTYQFLSMHAYMVQYHGDLYWENASAVTPASIVARRTYAGRPQSTEFRLELQQNNQMIDQTFVKLSDDENASANFIFDEDLCKEYNGTKANIYTFIEGYIPAAGNTLPTSEQTTVVPVGLTLASDGEYNFSMPEGTEGIGVVLIDNIAGTRTNLGLMDYSVTLEQGQIDNRFLLEISPIVQSPTDLENTEYRTQNTEVRKGMIDGILYIVKDGIVYDAQGHRVQ